MENNLGSIFKQAKELQSKMADIQKDLAGKTVEVSTGGGMVKITANGIHQILSVQIDEELINMQDREVLEDLVLAAMNEVHRKVKELAQEEMTRLTGGIKIPGLFPNT
ncbi:MAG: nucleoid-associated protein, YbaB/EbfC family [Nitrospinaceae bacterium]|nr:MAG: nucleoid-associated protein, YbaB/EbfC family [Nitrospinaceae bacterium]